MQSIIYEMHKQLWYSQTVAPVAAATNCQNIHSQLLVIPWKVFFFYLIPFPDSPLPALVWEQIQEGSRSHLYLSARVTYALSGWGCGTKPNTVHVSSSLRKTPLLYSCNNTAESLQEHPYQLPKQNQDAASAAWDNKPRLLQILPSGDVHLRLLSHGLMSHWNSHLSPCQPAEQ